MSKKPTIYDETARLEQTTTTNPAECECWNWCSDGLHRREELLAGHHFRCSKFEAEFRRRALELIAQLYEAMQQWGAEEDGVPDFAWDAWVVAGAVTTGKYQGAKKGGEA
jgi:hypothetical protein